MSREKPWRRICPELVRSRIKEASEARFYVVQELGPMAFVLRDDGDRAIDRDGADVDSHGEAKKERVCKLKVGLGSRQTCSCSKFISDGEICVHILWVMVKMFRVPLESELLFQQSLVEREIGEIMRSRKRKELPVIAPKAENDTPPTANKDHVPRRPIEEGDVW
ncbi:E3 ubiquitin-protein ligase Zswim2 [Phlyctochytrium planicorne]|nr:E3 ubiquitin-protein ligase Zswim2 [Phlyctochytrium planicorne]